MARDLYLAIDVGTGGIRSALVDRRGTIVALSHREHEQIVPHFGWSEQRPDDWWRGTLWTIGQVLTRIDGGAARIAALSVCGQMHGTVLLDDDGALTLDAVPLWNDKRTMPQVAAFAGRRTPASYLAQTANIAAPAWPAFKLAWLREHHPGAFARTRAVLMPKDFIAYRLTGTAGWDWTEASMSFLMDAATHNWSPEMLATFDVPRAVLAPIRSPLDIVGRLSSAAAAAIGLSDGLPVVAGGGDYPLAILGSGAAQTGLGSDVTGTSTIISMLHDAPTLDPSVSNVMTPLGNWASFTLLDAGGDAVRWARRAFHDNQLGYAEVTRQAEGAAPGAGSLFFLPYLSGERHGDQPNSRAQFFGLTAAHGLPELHRAVLEGVAFSVRRTLDTLQGAAGRPERIVAAGGGAKNDLWLKIKASMYGTPYLVPRELECGVIGLAALMATAVGDKPDLPSAIGDMVQFEREIVPDPAWRERYDRMAPLYERLYRHSRAFYDDLDALDLAPAP